MFAKKLDREFVRATYDLQDGNAFQTALSMVRGGGAGHSRSKRPRSLLSLVCVLIDGAMGRDGTCGLNHRCTAGAQLTALHTLCHEEVLLRDGMVLTERLLKRRSRKDARAEQGRFEDQRPRRAR